ncbi:MAG: hypothetical protein LUD02_04310 [Tannerellaceae bacterium]|nr:hypothetical protein [Tannerellaceae bacterium]
MKTQPTREPIKGAYKECEVQFNPASLQLDKRIDYSKDRSIGSSKKAPRYKGHGEETLSFKLTFDGTGAVTPLSLFTTPPTVTKQILALEDVLYHMESETHQARYSIMTWGNFQFKGRLTSMKQEYNLFSPEGEALRANLSLSFTGFMEKQASARQEGKLSPDLTRIITIKAGESIAGWCEKIYHDASYCCDIARFNSLESFRYVEPGSTLLFPPLERYGNISDKKTVRDW